MAMFKDPSFQDRNNARNEAKLKALAALKNKAPVDEAVVAQRIAAAAAKQAAEAEKRAAKIAARVAAAEEKAAAKAAALAAAAPKPPPKLATAAEMKAARDARYAARKARL
jgi:hypothetical protein